MSGYRKTPDLVRQQIAHLDSDTFYIGGSRTFSLQELADGRLDQIGVTADSDGDGVVHPSAILPDAANGRWSQYNVNGRQIVRRDLDKVEKTIGGWEVPNFGDWNRGSHTHYSTRKVFQKETRYGQALSLTIDSGAITEGKVLIGIRVDRVFDRAAPDEHALHMACSLLRENTGLGATAIPSELSVADWLTQQQVTWELLPEGERTFDDVARHLGISGEDRRSSQVRVAEDRYGALLQLNPGPSIVGTGNFTRYFGFQFKDDLVVLENMHYGNALYVMFEDWRTLSQRSRLDLLADTSARYERIIHSSGWRGRLAAILFQNGHDVFRSEDGDA